MCVSIRLGASAGIGFGNTTPLGTDKTDTTCLAVGFVGFVGCLQCPFLEIQAAQLG